MRAVTLDGVVTEGLAEEVALGQELQAKGQASVKALRQPILRTLILLSSLSLQCLAQRT